MTRTPVDEALGAYLSALRSNAGLDVSVLARRVSLSAAQVLELESGRGSLFYNDRIRLQAARKIVIHLGGDLARLPGHAPPAAPSGPVDVLPLAEPVPLVQVASPVRHAPSAEASPGRAPGFRAAAWLAFAVLLGMGILAAVRGPARLAPSPQAADLASAIPQAPGAACPASEPAARPEAQADGKPLEVAAAALPEAPFKSAEGMKPETTQPPPHDKAVDRGDGPLSACAWQSGEVPVFQPMQARKPGDMVYVVSQVSQVLCVADATGRSQVQRLEAGQALSFYGQPPWQVVSSQLQLTQLYFQGWKVRLPAQAQDRIQLVELR